MASKKTIVKQKVKKKKWYPIYAPAIFGSKLIGESYVESVDELKGKFISSNLSTIMNDMKKQNITMKFRVSKVVEGKGQTEIIGLQQVQSFVKRLVRRGRSKVDDSFTATTKDEQLVRIKPLIITNTKCVRSTASQLRLETRKLIAEKLAKTGFINTVQEILGFRLQKEIKAKLNKIHPIRSIDIRVFAREAIRGIIPEADLELLPEVKEEPKPVKKEVSEEETKEEAEKEAPKAKETKEETPKKEEDSKVEEADSEEKKKEE